jgi:hypothetical protein
LCIRQLRRAQWLWDDPGALVAPSNP